MDILLHIIVPFWKNILKHRHTLDERKLNEIQIKSFCFSFTEK